MITVHHLDHSRSQRVLWLLEELALPYDIRFYKRDPKTLLAPPELRRVHPLGKAPVITHDGITVAESGAIIEYLLGLERYTRLIPPPGTEARRRFTYWLHFAEGSAMPPLLLKLVFDRIRTAPAPFFVKPIARGIAAKVERRLIEPNLTRMVAFIEAELSAQPWFAGSAFSAADVQMSFPIEAAEARGLVGASHPKTLDWLARIHARPAYRRALEAGGPYGVAA